jgi:hypothetical protein
MNLIEYNYDKIFTNPRNIFYYRNRYAHIFSKIIFNKKFKKLNIHEKFYLTYGRYNNDVLKAMNRYINESGFKNLGVKLLESNFIINYISWLTIFKIKYKQKKEEPNISDYNLSKNIRNNNKRIVMIKRTLNLKFYLIRKNKNKEFENYYEQMKYYHNVNNYILLKNISKALINIKGNIETINNTCLYKKDVKRFFCDIELGIEYDKMKTPLHFLAYLFRAHNNFLEDIRKSSFFVNYCHKKYNIKENLIIAQIIEELKTVEKNLYNDN